MAIYAPAIVTTLPSVPESYRPVLVASYVIQAAFLLTLLYVVTWPLSFSARAYSIAVPIVSGVAMVAQFVDSQLYQAVGFHMNGLFFRVLWQPGALREVGVPVSEVLLLAVLFAVWMVADATVGRRFLLRLATGRRAVTWAGAMLAVVLVERLGSAALIFNGGLAVDAAEQVLPLQPPMRLNGQMALLTGRRARIDSIPEAALQGPVRLPNEIDPASVRFSRTPDILFILIESLRADFLDPETMPRLWKRAHGGTVFERHYATSSSTHYALSACSTA